MGFNGISVWDLRLQSIARPYCRHTDGIRELIFTKIFIEKIIIIPDNDIVGREGGQKLKEILGQSYNTYIVIPEAKDVREWIEVKGKDYVKKEY